MVRASVNPASDSASSRREGTRGGAFHSTVEDRGAPAVRLLQRYLDEAVRRGASDLHFQSDGHGHTVRARIDGELVALASPPPVLARAVATRLRLMAGADLAEQRMPQDGRFAVRAAGGTRVEIRAAFLPLARGEKVALRLLPSQDDVRTLAGLGLPPAEAAVVDTALDGNGGLVVVAGPTGSGKTTTLYAALQRLRRPQISIVAVEDPVEIDLEGIAQVGVDEAQGRSFAAVLRAFLRQDPDVLMVGEVRDGDSARIACRAALTGHLVLTSIHASDAAETLLRIPEMSVPRYLVDATVSLILAQRLLRRLCEKCCEVRHPAEHERDLFLSAGLPLPKMLGRPRGCPCCNDSGYRGRLAVFEAHVPSTARLFPSLNATGALPLLAPSLTVAGLRRAAVGDTTVAEVLAHCPAPSLDPTEARAPLGDGRACHA